VGVLNLLQKFDSGHVRHDHIGEHHVHRLFFKQRQGSITALGFEAYESQRLADGDAEAANSLFVVNDQ
jgi:hypothetical protein